MRTAHRALGLLALGLALAVSAPTSAAGPLDDVPPALRDWVGWVLHDRPDHACPFLHGTSARSCAWPGQLTLALGSDGGRFTQSFQVYVEGWHPLPGESHRWPQAVTLDASPAVVVPDAAGRPTILLSPGAHTVAGQFTWSALPDALALPPDTGLISLTVKGQPVPLPNRDAEGRLFLQGGAAEEDTDRAELEVYRLVTDEVPVTLTTRIELEVSGRSRELLLGRALPEGFVPMALHSPLPSRLEADGRLRLQVRPGRWTVELTARSQSPVATLRRPDPDGPWTEGDELWAFEARPSLRQVLVEGLAAVDPSQTSLPAGWRGFPAFSLGPDDEMTLTERRRGDSEPAPDALALTRTLWLDFAGTGYTVSDRVTGQLHRSWRLEVQPGTELGRVVASGADQPITRLAPEGAAGVELRQGAVALEADSRLPGPIDRLSAVSWDADFERVEATLQLPPGWRLVAARGADQVSGTWVDRWTLFDFFVVLVIAVATAKLFGLRWGALALVALGLSWQEHEVPQYAWLVVLGAEALVRVLPEGTLRWLLKAGRLAAWVGLVVLAVGFAVEHVRSGLYPGLAREQRLGGMMSFSEYSNENVAQYQRSLQDGLTRHAPPGRWESEASDSAEPSEALAPAAPPPAQAKTGKLRSHNVRDFDRNATVQTGPGLPRWEWTQVPIRFSGAVQRDQTLSLWLLGPGVNLALAVTRVLALGLLLLAFLGFPGKGWPRAVSSLRRTPPTPPVPPGPPAPSVTAAGLILALTAGLALFPAAASAQEPATEAPPEPGAHELDSTPDEGLAPAAPRQASRLLDTLRDRLLEPPRCAPSCASSPRLMLEASPRALTLRFEVLAGALTAVPLPGGAEQWVPHTVLLDGHPTPALQRRPDGTLWLAVSPGVHQVAMEGPLPQRETVQLALPMRSYRVDAVLDGWKLDGLHEDGVADAALQLTRRARGAGEAGAALQSGTLPPFVRVERTVGLGLKWTVDTTVRRLTAPGSAVVVEIPLLAGESVTTNEVRVQGGMALVNMPAGATEVSWSSVLDAEPPLVLTAPKTASWFELWRLEVSPMWHVTLAGIPVVHQQDAQGERLPEWRPWPGESVQVDIVRPEALAGQTLTVDQSSLTVSPGARATDVSFNANLRSSRGGLHPFTLPEGATLQAVAINGVQQPIHQEGRTVAIPLVPGSQSVSLGWREPSGMTASYRTPDFGLGTASVNANIELKVPQDRWVLLVRGPGLGPAVLFWSFVLVLVVVSLGLGRSRWTPLPTRAWVLLALGLSQVPIVAIAMVFAWLLFLSWREKTPELSPGWFNLRQLAVVGLTAVALVILGAGVYQGLLGALEMQVRGNGSNEFLLRWFQDRTEASYPRAWVLSAPLVVYRGAMLLWSLWMALSLVGWLKWGWGAFAAGGLWRRSPKAARAKPAPAAPQGPPQVG